jgi:hypothetical protein
MNRLRTPLTMLAVATGLLIPAGIAQAATSAPAPASHHAALTALPASRTQLASAQAAGAATTTIAASAQSTENAATGSCRSLYAAAEVHDSGDRIPSLNNADGVWTQNTLADGGCGYQGRIHIKCQFSDGSTHDYDGGWIYPENLNDAQSCPSGSFLIGAAWQSRGGPGQTVDTDWFYGP